jgi:hypothetical protein
MIVPLGGRKEKPFFNITSYTAETSGCPHAVVPMIVPFGEIPAYYPHDKGDLLLGQTDASSIAAFSPPSATRNDFLMLQNAGIKLTELVLLSQDLVRKPDGNKIDRHPRRDGPPG